MKANLKDRLNRIKTAQKEVQDANVIYQKQYLKPKENCFSQPFPVEWETVAYKTLRRRVLLNVKFPKNNDKIELQNKLNPALAILVPDFFNYIKDSKQENIDYRVPVFFDLETTGLAAGSAGTLAFLAAFGRFVKNGLEVTQYLLLDFPGEAEFLETILSEFTILRKNGPIPLIVSYNGKSFDSQIIKSRCIMKGIFPPVYFHADLLHPSRRLWKRRLTNCSQSTIETEALGIDRTDDIPGSLAPEIWFSFLQTGNNTDLLGICEHNLKDITGLAALFLTLNEIAGAPAENCCKFNVDTEALALMWRNALCWHSDIFTAKEEKNVEALIKICADNNNIQILRILAIEAEWKKGDYKAALDYTERLFTVPDLQAAFLQETFRRKDRLIRKINLSKKS